MEETKDDVIQEQTHAHETSPTHAQETSPEDKVASYMENENNGQVLSINLDVRTRWNSAYDMISKFIKLKGAIQQFSAFLKSVSGKKDFNRKKLPRSI